MTSGYALGHVPTAPIRREILEWIKQIEDGKEACLGIGPRGLLAVQSKVNPRRLWSIVSGRQKWCEFAVADRLLCYLEKTYLWVTDEELSEAYASVNLNAPTKSMEWIAKQMESTCPGCKQDFVYYPDFQAGRFCSARCASSKGGLNRWANEAAAA